MNRLTEKSWRNLDPWECCGQDNYCQRGCHDEGGCNKGCIVPKIYDRLATYEDSGLSPEEVQELVKAKAEGRLVVLPCKVGDSIWLAISGQIREYIFMGITQQYGYLPSLYGRQRFGKYEDVGIALVDSIGKTVFLSREAAEKAIVEVMV